MFKNLKIGVRLGLGFGFVTVLLLVISGIAYQRMDMLNQEIMDMVNDKFPKTVYANDIIDSLNTIGRAMRNAMLVKGEENIRKELDRIPEQRKIIGERLDKLTQLIRSEEGKAVLKRMVDSRVAYVALQEKFIELAKAGKRDEATELLLGDVRKSFNDYVKNTNDLISFQTGLMEKAGKHADEAADKAQLLILVLAGVSLLLAVSFAWWVTRSITRPLNEAVGVADELAQGNLMVKITVDSQDETGLLKTSMNNMLGKLSQIIGDVNTASAALNNAAGQVSATAQSLSQSSS